MFHAVHISVSPQFIWWRFRKALFHLNTRMKLKWQILCCFGGGPWKKNKARFQTLKLMWHGELQGHITTELHCTPVKQHEHGLTFFPPCAKFCNVFFVSKRKPSHNDSYNLMQTTGTLVSGFRGRTQMQLREKGVFNKQCHKKRVPKSLFKSPQESLVLADHGNKSGIICSETIFAVNL